MTATRILSLMLIAALGAATTRAQDAGPKTADTPGVTFSKRCLMVSPNEGCAVADVNRDGQLDIIAGTHWFAAPDYIPYRLRDIPEFGGDYLTGNGDLAHDVDSDGWIDVIAGGWMMPEIYWFRNPGKEKLARGFLWERGLLASGRTANEAYDLHDFDGDGVPEVFVNCWQNDAPVIAWKLAKDEEGKPMLQRKVIGDQGGGHGYAFGDLNGDGREDVLVGTGWYERPEGDPWARPWTFHKKPAIPHGSCPALIVDVDGDGRNDIVWGNAHGFGLYWIRQGEPDADGNLTWEQHLIDDTWSQPHCLVWEDIDADGQPELITGKRVFAHKGNDPGGKEPAVVFYYDWDGEAGQFVRNTIAGPGEGIGTGMQIPVVDLNGDGLLDIALSGKKGTYVLINQGRTKK